tara:strand:+ start:1283 stop:2407 length:1125 start_codon:yes stop_codon:yes gene_type:complete
MDNIIYLIIFNLLILSGLLFLIFKKNSKDEGDIDFDNKIKQLFKEVTDENNEALRQTNVSELNKTLAPFKEQLQRELTILKENIDSQKELSTKNFGKFEVEFQHLVNLSKGIGEEADNLTKALKGDTKQQGDWGERILERSFEDAGLIEDLEYILQPTYKDKNGDNYRPDAVVKLPDERDVIIDSKVSIKAYVDFVNSENDSDRENYLKLHIKSIKDHIKELSKKDYSRLEGVNSPDFVFMFVPNDSALQVAVTNDNWGIQELANKAKISLISPFHLMSVLRITAYMWRIDRQTKNVEKIAERAGLFMDKYSSFVEDFSKISDKLKDAMDTYDNAEKKLVSGSGNLHSQIKLLEEQGMKGKKDIPDLQRALDDK